MKNQVRILVASQKEAKLFGYEKEKGFYLIQFYDDAPFSKEPEMLSNSERPHKRKQNRGFADEKEGAQKEDLRHHFIHHICERLNKDLEKHNFKYLSILAEAKALGDLRKYLSKALTKLVTYEGTHNLVNENDDQIIEHLKKIGTEKFIQTHL